jgi:anti-sigma regulatory factor (Ser/Thr protein kinase)
MQAHPLSTTAARISSLPSSLPPTPALTRPASSLALPRALPPSLLLPAPLRSTALRSRAEPHAGRVPFPSSIGPGSVAQQVGLAHDAGNLLGALRLYSDLLGAPGVLRAEHRHYAEELSLIAARSTALIARLLQSSSPNAVALAQPDAEPGRAAEPATSRPASTAAVLRNLAPVLERIAAGAARVTVSTPATVPAVEVPAEALERIVVNLVRNAAEAIRSSREGSRGAGQIRIALEVFAGALRLTVEDNGPGMPPAVAAAFLRPAPLPAGATRGLGHRIVHELAASTGGQLSIRVRPGRGSIFCIRWALPEAANTEPAGRAVHSGHLDHDSTATFALPQATPCEPALAQSVSPGVPLC